MAYNLRFFSSSKCSLFHNSNVFGSCIIHILYTGCAKIIKNYSGSKWLNKRKHILLSQMYCVWQVVKTPTIISNNPVFMCCCGSHNRKRLFRCTVIRFSLSFPCAVRTKVLHCIDMFFRVPWFRRPVAGLSPRRLGFYPKSFHVRFVVNKVSLGQFSLQVLLFLLSLPFYLSSISIFTLVPERQTGQSWEPSN